MFFWREEEYKYKNRNLFYDDLFKDFFDAFNLVNTIGTDDIEDPIFLNNIDFNNNLHDNRGSDSDSD